MGRAFCFGFCGNSRTKFSNGAGEQQIPHRAFSPVRNDKGFWEMVRLSRVPSKQGLKGI
jgi:hypothetical protein